MNIKHKFRQAGFTLIEVLVVIAIIGILSSIVITTISTVRDKAQFAKFKYELTQMRTAVILYRDNNGGAWPSAIGYKTSETTEAHGNIQTLAAQLYAAGVYPSNTFTIPRMISGVNIWGGSKNGSDVGCGDPQSYLTAEHVYWFAPDPSFGNGYANQFPNKYHGTTKWSQFRCFEFI